MLFPSSVPGLTEVVTKRRNIDIDKERHHEELDAFHAEAIAAKAKDRVEKQLEATTANINNEYRRRIREARAMVAQLTKSAADLDQEHAALLEARNQLMDYLGQMQNPLELNLQWVQLRKAHRRSSLTGRGVAEAIENNQRDLKQAIVKATAAISELDTTLKRLTECIEHHQREIKNKNISVVLDSACLVPNLEVPVRDEHSVKLHSSVMRRDNMHIENEWRNNVAALLSNAPIMRQTARHVVLRAKAVVRWIVENGFLDRPSHVIDVLKINIKDSEKHQKQLEYNRRMVQGQMLALEKNRAQLLGTLEKVHQKVVETQRRLDMKLVRPSIEDTRRDIDEELERATTSLLQSELAIKNQLFDVETRRQRLILLYQDIETELSAKKRAHAVDRSCLEANLAGSGARGTSDPTQFVLSLAAHPAPHRLPSSTQQDAQRRLSAEDESPRSRRLQEIQDTVAKLAHQPNLQSPRHGSSFDKTSSINPSAAVKLPSLLQGSSARKVVR